MIHHKHVVALSRGHPLAQGLEIFSPLQALVGDAQIRIFLHESGDDLLDHPDVLRLVFISKKCNRRDRKVRILVIHHLILPTATRKGRAR